MDERAASPGGGPVRRRRRAGGAGSHPAGGVSHHGSRRALTGVQSGALLRPCALGSAPVRSQQGCSVVVPAATDGAAHRAHHQQDQADDQDDDPDRPQNGDIEKESNDEQDDTKGNHDAPTVCAAGAWVALQITRNATHFAARRVELDLGAALCGTDVSFVGPAPCPWRPALGFGQLERPRFPRP